MVSRFKPKVTDWVDAGSQSLIQRLCLTNNFYDTDAGYEDVSKAENVRITTKDNTGGFDLDLVQEKWIAVSCEDLFQYEEDADNPGQPDLSKPNFFPIGSDAGVDGGGNPIQEEVASYVCASLNADHTGNTTPATPVDGEIWRDTSQRFTIGDVFKRYDDDTSDWVEINEISGDMWVDNEHENNKANRIFMQFIATVPSRKKQ